MRNNTANFLLAIGGIHAGNTAGILAADADGIAVVSAICSTADPLQATRELREQIDTMGGE